MVCQFKMVLIHVEVSKWEQFPLYGYLFEENTCLWTKLKSAMKLYIVLNNKDCHVVHGTASQYSFFVTQ